MKMYEEAPDVDFYIVRNIKAAKKEHICALCKKTILKGNPYKRSSYVEDGKFGTQKVHPFIWVCYPNENPDNYW